MHSGSPFSRHTHETFPFDADISSTHEEDEEIIVVKVGRGSRYDDPDRLGAILVMNHDSELGEI